MTMKQAIASAKETFDWCVVDHEPTSVDILYMTRDGQEDQAKLDLYSDNKEEELDVLWESMVDEFNASKNGITGVFALGHLV